MTRTVDLEDDAADLLAELVEASRKAGQNASASRLVSNAIRAWYSLATGECLLLSFPEFEGAMAAAAAEAAAPDSHKTDTRH